jgi:hypothetical protein
VGAIESEHRDAVTETPQGGQGQAGLHADPGIAERRGHGPKSEITYRIFRTFRIDGFFIQ